MTFRRILVALATATLIPLAAAPSARAARTIAPASVSVSECTAGLSAADREVAFAGEMESVPGTARMQMRFWLESAASGSPRAVWRRLFAPGFGVWTSAKPGVTVYAYTKRVENLFAPSRYRTTVEFRWFNAGGEAMRRRRIVSRTCLQPDLRPDLVAEGITVEGSPMAVSEGGGSTSPAPEPAPASAPRVRYVVPVVNTGRATAAAFDVVVTVGGQALPKASVSGLAPRERREVLVEGPPCRPGTKVLVAVDPAGAVSERDEADNDASIECG